MSLLKGWGIFFDVSVEVGVCPPTFALETAFHNELKLRTRYLVVGDAHSFYYLYFEI
jgi:hypothetical protein